MKTKSKAMTKEEQFNYATLISSMSVDFSFGKITWEHYTDTLKMIINKIDKAEL